jgi:hypothetical protein
VQPATPTDTPAAAAASPVRASQRRGGRGETVMPRVLVSSTP